MRKRLSLLVAVLAVLSLTVAATGAYFTATQPGNINSNLGTVVIATSGTDINFANLMPGEMQTKTVTVRNDGTGNEDIYVAFKNDNGAWSWVNQLGMYGKFVIAGKTFDNLNNNSAYTAANPGVAGTDTDTDGPCGLPQQPINYLPHVVNIFTLTPGQTATFDVSFGWSACLSDPAAQGAAALPLSFSIAAFQPGVDPTSALNGAGQIVPLVLTSYAPYTNQ